MLSVDMKKTEPISTAKTACLECSCGYGYVCVKWKKQKNKRRNNEEN